MGINLYDKKIAHIVWKSQISWYVQKSHISFDMITTNETNRKFIANETNRISTKHITRIYVFHILCIKFGNWWREFSFLHIVYNMCIVFQMTRIEFFARRVLTYMTRKFNISCGNIRYRQLYKNHTSWTRSWSMCRKLNSRHRLSIYGKYIV